MFAVIGAVLGAALGFLRATRAKGNLADKLQYAIAHGIAFFLLFLGLTIFADWQGWV